MKPGSEGKLLRIFIGESNKHGGRPLFEAIVHEARRAGLAGATVLRGTLGYGGRSRIHTTKVLRLSEDLPMVVEIVDEAAAIDAFLPTLDGMMDEGMVTVEKVTIITYRPGNGDEEGEDPKNNS